VPYEGLEQLLENAGPAVLQVPGMDCQIPFSSAASFFPQGGTYRVLAPDLRHRVAALRYGSHSALLRAGKRRRLPRLTACSMRPAFPKLARTCSIGASTRTPEAKEVGGCCSSSVPRAIF